MMFISLHVSWRIIIQAKKLFRALGSGDMILIKKIAILLSNQPCQTAKTFLSPSKRNILLIISIFISLFPPLVLFVPLPIRQQRESIPAIPFHLRNFNPGTRDRRILLKGFHILSMFWHENISKKRF